MEDELEHHVESYEKLLVVVLDTNPFVWGRTGDDSVDGEILQTLSFTQYLENVLLFLNAHLMMHPLHRCAVVASHNTKSVMLFPPPEDTPTASSVSGSGQHELFQQINGTIIAQIKAMALEPQHTDTDTTRGTHTMLAAALCRSLCYIQRVAKEMPVGRGLKARILVVYASRDNSSQYMPVMNTIFAAQKKKVPIDSCVLADRPSSFLQQASEITQGLYVNVASGRGFLEHLLTVFLGDQEDRKVLRLPRQTEVDYRAACFCHNKIIDLAYVCSVCLSIFCEPRGVCSTCHSRFKVRAIRPKAQPER